MRTIGLIGGMSWQSSRLYYDRINQMVADRLGGAHSAKLIVNSLDFGPIAKMQAADQTRLVDLLRRLSVATYADRFDKFEGQRFERQGVQTSKSGSVVKTVIVRSNGERVSLHYYFRAGKIFNVVADGVSDLALRRSDYGSILKREGLAALFKHVEQNVAELE